VIGRLRALRARRGELYGINRRNIELVYAFNPRRHYPIADDKLLAKEYLARAGVPVAETLAVCHGLFEVRAFIEFLRGRADVVIKPANGSGGDGIVVLTDWLGDGRWRRAGGGVVDEPALYRHVAEITLGAFANDLADRAFVEPRIAPHPMFQALWSDGLCDVRIITLEGEPLMSMVRVPTRQSGGRANLHRGGIGLAVDMATGTTVRALHRGRAIERHPESGAALLDLSIPSWPAVVDSARAAARAVPLGYIGCDVVVDAELGPLLLEINARPGLEIQNVNGLGFGRALGRASR